MSLKSRLHKLLFPLIGTGSLIWILIRVIPKPSRAQYPCVKAASPFASGFLLYLISLVASTFVYLKSKKKINLSPYIAYFGLAIGVFGGSYLINEISTSADVLLPNSVHEANSPLGTGQGIFPGRVVWVYDVNATNQDCIPTSVGHAWWMPENNDQIVIDDMVSKAIQSLTGEADDQNAWDSIFKYHNNTRGKGAVVYTPGEKIFIKINNVSGWFGNFQWDDLSVSENDWYGVSETSPQIILALLKQLVNVAGVAQNDIYVGDPMRNIYKHCYEMWHNEFPNVHYVSHDDYSKLGREQLTASTTAQIFYSDKGTILRENVWDANRPGGAPVTDDYLYTIFEEAEYLLNVPQLKGHKRAGMTMFAKNHFGSHTRADASHLHNGLVDPTEIPNSPGISRTDYGMYRVQVDIMAHELLGGKNLFYLLDALWAADQEISFPKKFTMQPFNNDWMSSVFASFDPVAIESVGYDFLRSEFTADRDNGDDAGTYVQKLAADDYLHQAADSSLWPEDIQYDPDNDGNYFSTLGVHEHWNNEIDKQYSRNLGNDSGIELVKIINTTNVEDHPVLVSGFHLNQNFPNPFNPVTEIRYQISEQSHIRLVIHDNLGREIINLVDEIQGSGNYSVTFNGSELSTGVYYYQLSSDNFNQTKKMILIK